MRWPLVNHFQPRAPKGAPALGFDLVARVLQHVLPRRFWYRHFYLRSAYWQARALQAKIDANFTCGDCGRRRRRDQWLALDVHHMNYDRLWRERASDLMVLCRRCHDCRHGKES